MRHATWDSDRLQILRLSARYHAFTSYEVAEALRSFDWDSKRLDALRILAPQIIGRPRRFLITDTFDFSSSRQQAARILDRYAY